MIGTVLHLWGRVVDRARGADVASLRVKVAALSARVVAAEGEVERLRGERSRQVSWRGVAVALEREVVEARAETERLRGLVSAYKVAEDAFFEADGNVAILGADNAMEAAKRDLFAAVETP